MGAAPITLRINVNLDANTWAARDKFASGIGSIHTDGSGLTDISSIEIFTSYDNSSFPQGVWGTNASDGVSTNYVQVDSIEIGKTSLSL